MGAAAADHVARRRSRHRVVAGVEIPPACRSSPTSARRTTTSSRWDRPDEFDIFREQKPFVAFGVGPHMCLGMHLARMEMRVAVDRLLDRCPGLRPDPDAWERDDVHIHGEALRSPTSLPVVFDPA